MRDGLVYGRRLVIADWRCRFDATAQNRNRDSRNYSGARNRRANFPYQ